MQDLTNVLMSANQQQSDMAQKLIAANAQQTIDESQLETMGNIVNMFA